MRALIVVAMGLCLAVLAWFAWQAFWLESAPLPQPGTPAAGAAAAVGEVREPGAGAAERNLVAAGAEPSATAEPVPGAPRPEAPKVTVRGVVVFPDGAPVEGVKVMLMSARRDIEAIVRRATSDVRGAFVVEDLCAGEFYVNADGSGALVQPRTTTIPAGVTAHDLRVVVERPDPATTITGVVVDEQGVPLADVAVSGYGEGFYGTSQTGADGTFTVARAAPRHDDGKPGAALTASKKGREQVTPGPEERVRWGQKDVRVVMRPLPETWLVVRNPAGAPAPNYDVLWLRRDGRGNLVAQSVIPTRVAQGGRTRLSSLRLGRHVLFVRGHPSDPSWRAIGPIEFEVSPAGVPAEVVAQTTAPAELHVTAAGVPSPEFTAELVCDVSGAPCTLDCKCTDFDVAQWTDLQKASWFSMARGAADDTGVVLRVPPGRYTLRVRGDGLLPQLHVLDVPAGASHKVLQLARGGVLEGRLGPPEALATVMWEGEFSHVRVLARPLDGGPAPPAAPVAENGTFTIGALPEGRCALTFEYPPEAVLGSAVVGAPLGEVVIRSGQTTRAEFDVRPCMPGTMTLRVTLDGAPMAGAQLFVRRIEPHSAARATADERGIVEKALAPGTYDVLLAIAAQPGPGWHMLPLPDRLQIVAGGTHDYTVAARIRTMRIRLLDAAGRPVAGRRVKVEGQRQYFRVGGLSTDEAGRVEITPAPYGPFTLQLLGDGGAPEVQAGPFELPAAQDRGEADFRLR